MSNTPKFEGEAATKFRHVMEFLFRYYRTKLKEEQLSEEGKLRIVLDYECLLADLPIDAIQESAFAHCQSSQWFPMASQLRPAVSDEATKALEYRQRWSHLARQSARMTREDHLRRLETQKVLNPLLIEGEGAGA